MAGGTLDSEFDERFDQLFRVAYRAAYRLCGRPEEAEDIAQEVLARCLTRWAGVSGYAEAWVSRAASNLAIDRWRRKDRAVGRVERTSTDRVAAVDLRRDLVGALGHLSRRQREVVVLRYVNDLPEKDVAGLLGCTVGTVKRHAHRGLEALRRHLGDGYAPAFGPPRTPPAGHAAEEGVSDDV